MAIYLLNKILNFELCCVRLDPEPRRRKKARRGGGDPGYSLLQGEGAQANNRNRIQHHLIFLYVCVCVCVCVCVMVCPRVSVICWQYTMTKAGLTLQHALFKRSLSPLLRYQSSDSHFKWKVSSEFHQQLWLGWTRWRYDFASSFWLFYKLVAFKVSMDGSMYS